jgi:4-hydroxyphenylpyruvate dioxygenase-like putative hemolysin
MEGVWLDRVVGLKDVKTELVMMRTPDRQVNLELANSLRRRTKKGIQNPSANTLGIRHIAFVVEDIEAMVAKLKKKGMEIFGEIQTTKTSISYATFVGQKGSF